MLCPHRVDPATLDTTVHSVQALRALTKNPSGTGALLDIIALKAQLTLIRAHWEHILVLCRLLTTPHVCPVLLASTAMARVSQKYLEIAFLDGTVQAVQS